MYLLNLSLNHLLFFGILKLLSNKQDICAAVHVEAFTCELICGYHEECVGEGLFGAESCTP